MYFKERCLCVLAVAGTLWCPHAETLQVIHHKHVIAPANVAMATCLPTNQSLTRSFKSLTTVWLSCLPALWAYPVKTFLELILHIFKGVFCKLYDIMTLYQSDTISV